MENNYKKFITWNKIKIKLHNNSRVAVYFYEREIWWASLGINIGYEEDGKNEKFERPILILKKFNKNILWALPLTSKNKIGDYYHQFDYAGAKFSIILSQLRLISSQRLSRKIRSFPRDEFIKIKEKIKSFL